MSASRWRIHDARRLIGFGLMAGAALAASACSDSKTTTPPQVHRPASLVVSPAAVNIGAGVHFQFHATVFAADSTPADDQRVTWSIAPSTMSVSDSGVVWSECTLATGTVTATSVADTTVTGSAYVIVAIPLQPTVSISAIYKTGTQRPATLDSVTDSITVVGGAFPTSIPCSGITEVDLVIHRSSGDTVVARIPTDSTATQWIPVDAVFHSDAKVNGVPVFPNGDYSLRLDALMTGGQPPQASSTFHFTIRNP